MATQLFNDEFRKRTKQNALNVIRLYSELNHRDELKILGKQAIRSATSVAANFRASCRGRSPAEHYAKICIVVEECDETLFWLELIADTKLVDQTILNPLITETFKILQVFSKTRKSLKP
ncbi:MAG: four helix bundle protein [Alphaproteobacteria bacterium]|nr:four helix bundle protein [Alphaproteobacteria bacterium]